MVDLKEKGLVKLALNGVDLRCSNDAPLYIKQAERTVVVLAQGTQNHLADGDSRKSVSEVSPSQVSGVQATGGQVPSGQDPEIADASPFSKDDLTIAGSGKER